MAEVLPVAFLVSSSFFSDIVGSEGRKLFLKQRPTQTRKHFHDALSWHLIFLLHPAALHENITLQLRSFSLEDDITTLSY